MKQCHGMTKQLGIEGKGMGWIKGNKQKVSGKVSTLKMFLVCARDLQQVMSEDKKYLNKY